MADTIRESARDVPVIGTYDVCVIGGSCTGVFAAVAAARLGASVCVIECNGFFGGVATAGLVSIWHSAFDTEGDLRIIGGLTSEVVERLQERDAARVRPPDDNRYVELNTAELTIELDALVTEAAVRPFLHTRFVAPVVAGDGRLAAVIVEDKTGRRAIRASAFVDATGDGDVVGRMGLSTRTLDDLQPPTTCAIIRGLEHVAQRNPGFSLRRTVFDPAIPDALGKGFLWSTPVVNGHDETMVAGTRVHDADCSDADTLTRAEIEGRRQVRRVRDILRQHCAGGQAVSIAQLPATIGIRETRHATCLHRLTEEEVLCGVRFPDAIANGSYRVDVHHSERQGLTFRYLDGREVFVGEDGTHESGRWREPTATNPTFYQIPYGSLVPKGAENVLVAGRLTDADRGAYGAIRVMVNCNQTGEAAGTAAALAACAGVPVHAVDPLELRKTMSAQGSVII